MISYDYYYIVPCLCLSTHPPLISFPTHIFQMFFADHSRINWAFWYQNSWLANIWIQKYSAISGVQVLPLGFSLDEKNAFFWLWYSDIEAFPTNYIVFFLL